MAEVQVLPIPFLVDSAPHCYWDLSDNDKNRHFLNNIDHLYFKYIAETNESQLATGNKHRAALAIRLAYHQGIETMFTLLCACLQAPDCVPAWIINCKTHHLRNLIQNVSDPSKTVDNVLDIKKVTWRSIANHVVPCAHPHQDIDDVRKRFALLWQRLAHEHLSEENINEYNSIKHGLRVRLGGFTLRAGVEDTYGEPPPQDQMQVVGHSEFGSSFYYSQKIKSDIKPKGKDVNFKLLNQALGWNPLALSASLDLITYSLLNVKSFLMVYNGHCKPSDVLFCCPTDLDEFDKPLRMSITTTKSSFNRTFIDKNIPLYSKEKIKIALSKDSE